MLLKSFEFSSFSQHILAKVIFSVAIPDLSFQKSVLNRCWIKVCSLCSEQEYNGKEGSDLEILSWQQRGNGEK